MLDFQSRRCFHVILYCTLMNPVVSPAGITPPKRFGNFPPNWVDAFRFFFKHYKSNNIDKYSYQIAIYEIKDNENPF